jgi:hypothetical protein
MGGGGVRSEETPDGREARKAMAAMRGTGMGGGGVRRGNATTSRTTRGLEG